LLFVWPTRRYVAWQRHRAAQFGGLVEGGHDSDILASFFAGRLGLDPIEDAAREVDELGGELVALDGLSLSRAPFGRYFIRQSLGILICGFDPESVLRSDDLVPAGVGGVEGREFAVLAQRPSNSRFTA